MRDPLLRSSASLLSSNESWFFRVRENLRQVFAASPLFPTSANGAPIHFPKWKKSPRSGRAQGVSLITHAAILAVLVQAAVAPKDPKPLPVPSDGKISSSISVPGNVLELLRGMHPAEGSGSGAGHDFLPARQGNLPPRSSIQLLKPTIPQSQNPELPIPPTILDAAVPRVLSPVDEIGLPWMPGRNNSSGRGKGNTLGDGTGDSIGSSPGDDAGWGEKQGFYKPGMTMPRCAYCPDAQYTDEAREAKVQGSVTLRVLVDMDGRASQIRVVRGIGMGLDERAMQAIRGWKFVPARDAGHRPVSSWVTVETVFRLF